MHMARCNRYGGFCLQNSRRLIALFVESTLLWSVQVKEKSMLSNCFIALPLSDPNYYQHGVCSNFYFDSLVDI